MCLARVCFVSSWTGTYKGGREYNDVVGMGKLEKL